MLFCVLLSSAWIVGVSYTMKHLLATAWTLVNRTARQAGTVGRADICFWCCGGGCVWGRGVLQVILSPLGSGSTRQHDRQVRVPTHAFSLPPPHYNARKSTVIPLVLVTLSTFHTESVLTGKGSYCTSCEPCHLFVGVGTAVGREQSVARAAAEQQQNSGGSNWRRNRQAGCFGVLAAFTPLPFMVTTHPLNLSTSLVYAGTTVGQ